MQKQMTFNKPTHAQGFNPCALYAAVIRHGEPSTRVKAAQELRALTEVKRKVDTLKDGGAVVLFIDAFAAFRCNASPELFARLFGASALHLWDKWNKAGAEPLKFAAGLDSENTKTFSNYIQKTILNF